MDIDTYIQEIETIANKIATDYGRKEIKSPMEPYSTLFFNSQALTAEWISDQFG